MSVLDLYDRMTAGDPVLLVCAYESESRFRKNRIEGAIHLSKFRERLPALDRRTEIVFYCN